MRDSDKRRLSVPSQGRVYATVMGVVVGMLAAGLGVPLAFGHLPSTGDAQQSSLSPSTEVSLPPITDSSSAPSVAPTAGPGGALPTLAPGSGTTGGGSSTGTTGLAGSGTSGGGGSTTGGRSVLTASDQGVTATTVKLGVVLLDIEKLKSLGFAVPHYTPQEQQQQYQAFIDDANAHGGLLGRKIVPVYRTYDALDSNGSHSAGAVCSQLAEDEKVFAAVGIIGGHIDLCLSIQHHIPSITDGAENASVYEQTHHLIISPLATYERGAANWGDMVFRAGLLNGHKSGTVYTDQPPEAGPEGALVQSLKADGHTVTYRAKLANDAGSASSQMPIEVQAMYNAGVDTVFLSTNFVTALQWVRTAEQAEPTWRPHYLVSDVGALTGEGLVHNMGQSFDGAIAYTGHSAVLPEGPEDASCRATFNRLAHQKYAAGSESVGLRTFCGMIKNFAAGARAAGTTLTRTGFVNAVQTLGNLGLPNVVQGTFGPGKTDYDDWQRPMRWSYSCKCYQNAGPAQRNRY